MKRPATDREHYIHQMLVAEQAKGLEVQQLITFNEQERLLERIHIHSNGKLVCFPLESISTVRVKKRFKYRSAQYRSVCAKPETNETETAHNVSKRRFVTLRFVSFRSGDQRTDSCVYFGTQVLSLEIFEKTTLHCHLNKITTNKQKQTHKPTFTTHLLH